jgi:hypothetical protein
MTYIRAQWQILGSAGKHRVGLSRHKYIEQSITVSYPTRSQLPADKEQSDLNFFFHILLLIDDP